MIFQTSEDARVIGKVHGLLGVPEETLVADSPDSRFWSAYRLGHSEGVAQREQFLSQGKTAEWIAEYIEPYLAGWTDATISKMGGPPSPGWREALRRMAIKN